MRNINIFFLDSKEKRIILFFFFSSRRRHTRSARDWSSDVCSSDLDAAFGRAGAEALAAFGDGSIYLEKLISTARHVEVQVLCDADGGVLTLGERECSIQRRHQKLIEESPSPALDEPTRAAMAADVERACRA